jgi:hypothetical protein
LGGVAFGLNETPGIELIEAMPETYAPSSK